MGGTCWEKGVEYAGCISSSCTEEKRGAVGLEAGREEKEEKEGGLVAERNLKSFEEEVASRSEVVRGDSDVSIANLSNWDASYYCKYLIIVVIITSHTSTR